MNKNEDNIKKFTLPLKRSTDKDFYEDLKDVLDAYLCFIKAEYPQLQKKIACNNEKLLQVISNYFLGLSHESYKNFEILVNSIWWQHPPVLEKVDELATEDAFTMYRMRIVPKKDAYEKSELFHLPYFLKEKAPTCRYSIPGFPCLYMNTELTGCYSEINGANNRESEKGLLMCAVKYNRAPESTSINSISVLDLSRNFANIHSLNQNEKESYLLWYPVIAASSFIRRERTDSLASEYIIPQMLLQYVRTLAKDKKFTLWGIRYLSCSSAAASERGINYVFPVCDYSRLHPYCQTLKKAFLFSEPMYFENNGPTLSSKKSFNLFWENKKKKFDNTDYTLI